MFPPSFRFLKGVGFLRACLPAELPSRAFLPPCERDARAPSTRDAGNAGVSPALPTAREKTYPFKPLGSPRCARGTEKRGRFRRCARGTCRRGFRFSPLHEGKRGGVAGEVYKRVRDDPTTFIEMRFSVLLTILRQCGFTR